MESECINIKSLIIAAFASLLLFTSCKQCIHEVGDYTTRTIETGDFNKLVIDGKFTLMEYSSIKSDSSYLEISGFPNYLDSLIIENKNEEVHVKIKEGNYCNDNWILIKAFYKDNPNITLLNNVYYGEIDSNNQFIDN